MNGTVDDIIAIVRRTFDPVSDRLELRGPALRRENMFFSLGYFGKTIGYEVMADLSPFNLFVMPFLMNDRDEVPVSYTDDSGARKQRYLQDVLAKLRINYEVEDKELRRLGGNCDNCEILATILAKLLEENWSRICEHANELFPDRDSAP